MVLAIAGYSASAIRNLLYLSDRGMGCRGGGTILHTTDGGKQWVEQTSDTTAVLYATHFLNDRQGTVVGALGTVLSTKDAGLTWVPQETQHAVTLFDVFFTDMTTGWVVGNAGALFQTTDGGARWIDHTLPCGKTCTRLTDLLKVRFTSSQEGWIVGERGMLYHTTDAGITWSEENPSLQIPYLGSVSLMTRLDGRAAKTGPLFICSQPANLLFHIDSIYSWPSMSRSRPNYFLRNS